MTGCAMMTCCYPCIGINHCFKYQYDEVIDHVADGLKGCEEFFESRSQHFFWQSWWYRILGTTMNILGLFLLSIPSTPTLKQWIPLISIMTGSLAPLTPLIVSTVAGMTLSCFILSLAWAIYRPALALCLLCLCGLGTYILFFVTASSK